jgi:hypothetical protein
MRTRACTSARRAKTSLRCPSILPTSVPCVLGRHFQTALNGHLVNLGRLLARQLNELIACLRDFDNGREVRHNVRDGVDRIGVAVAMYSKALVGLIYSVAAFRAKGMSATLKRLV